MRILIAAAAVSVLAAPAAAETFQTTSVEIRDAAAELTVIAEDRANVDVSITGGSRLAAPQARMTAEGVVIDGGLRNRFRGCTNSLGGRTQVRISGIGNVAREDLPRITLRVPRQLDLSAGGAIYTEIGPSAGGVVTMSGCGDTEIADVGGGLDLTLNGSGDIDVTRVAGTLAAVLNGSGSLEVERADAEAALRLNGSGDLQVGQVGGRLNAQLSGSGSLRTGAAAGNARLVLNGSGNVYAGSITGALDADLRGSGSMRVASVNGERAALNLTSSGSLVVSAGQVARLEARSTGSGSVRYSGSAAVTRASLTGSGSITIHDAGRVESLSDTGSGSINVGR